MSSSAQNTYSTTSTVDTITLSDTITFDFSKLTSSTSISSMPTVGSITLTSPTTSTYSYTTCIPPTISINDIRMNWNEEWVDSFPEWARIEKMCEEYPGLKIAFEKFKTVYKLVKDDYDTPKDKRPRP